MVTGEPYYGDEEPTGSMPAQNANASESSAGQSGDAQAAASRQAGKAKNAAKQAANQAADTAQNVVNQAQQTAQPAIDQAQQTAVQVKHQVQQSANSALESRKDQAAQSLDGLASAISTLGQQLHENNQPLASVADEAAHRVNRAAGYLHERDVRDLVGEAEGFARRQPALFLAGAFTLGVFAARFLKSSQSDAGPSGRPYSSGSYGPSTTDLGGSPAARRTSTTGHPAQWEGQGAPYGVYDPGSRGESIREVRLP